jgi:hypothetical protein
MREPLWKITRGKLEKMKSMSLSPYYYVRWTWQRSYEAAELAEKLGGFTVRFLNPPGKDGDMITVSNSEIEFLDVKADTLSARLASSKAVLFQKESAPFTKRDMELRSILFQLYNHSRGTPLPWPLNREPRFETQITS